MIVLNHASLKRDSNDDLLSDDDEEEMLLIPNQVYKEIEYEFKIGGMTCVACSSSVERLMHNEFDSKGMVKVSIVLLTHKMKVSFDSSSAVTSDDICEEVEMIGFDCNLIQLSEIVKSGDQTKVTSKQDAKSTSNLIGFESDSESTTVDIFSRSMSNDTRTMARNRSEKFSESKKPS